MNRLEYMLKMEAGNVGLGPMPSFLWVFTDDQRDQVINYIVDEKTVLQHIQNKPIISFLI